MNLFRRLYSTGVTPKPVSAALVSSTPKAVRIRRNRFPESLVVAEEDSTLSDVEQTTYNRLKARGGLTVQGPDGPRELSEEEWLERTNAKRRRIRGIKPTSSIETEQMTPEEVQVVGHRIYLPNIVFRLVRNFTPPGEPYNPYEATFRVPQSVTKLDIRGYLLAMYGVHTTYIRTDNRLAAIRRNRKTFRMERLDSEDNYKRAVVGLEEPFYFPQAREDMNVKEREERDEYFNEKFNKEQIEKMKSRLRSRIFYSIGRRNEEVLVSSRGRIVRRVMEQKLARESAVAKAVDDMLADADVAEKLPTIRTV